MYRHISNTEIKKRKELLLQSGFWMKQFKELGISTNTISNLNLMLSDEYTLLIPLYSSFRKNIVDFIELKHSLNETIVVPDNNQCIAGILPFNYNIRVTIVDSFLELLYGAEIGVDPIIFVPIADTIPDIVYKFNKVYTIQSINKQLFNVFSIKDTIVYNIDTFRNVDLKQATSIRYNSVKSTMIYTFPFVQFGDRFVIYKANGFVLQINDKHHRINRQYIGDDYFVSFDIGTVLLYPVVYENINLIDARDCLFTYFYNNCSYLSESECKLLTYFILAQYTFPHYIDNSIVLEIFANKRYILQHLYSTISNLYPRSFYPIRRTIGVYAKTHLNDLYTFHAPQIIVNFFPITYKNYLNNIIIKDKQSRKDKIKNKFYKLRFETVIHYLINFFLQFNPIDESEIDERKFTDKYRWNELTFLRILLSTLQCEKDYNEIVDLLRNTRRLLDADDKIQTLIEFDRVMPEVDNLSLLSKPLIEYTTYRRDNNFIPKDKNKFLIDFYDMYFYHNKT